MIKWFNRKTATPTVHSVIRLFGNSVISPIRLFGNSVISPDHSVIRATRKGFTLIELLVVIAMITVIMGALATSVTSARERARIQKATSDVKVISQAILAYENYARGGKYELPTMEDADADADSLGFLVGKGGSAESGGEIPVLLQAALDGGGKMRDPWGKPYKVTIREGNANLNLKTVTGTLTTGYNLPNLYRNN